MKITRPVAPPVSAKPPSTGITPADRSTAQKLKPAILDFMSRARFTQTPEKDAPKWDSKAGVYKAPNGHALFAVTLQTPPAGSADMPVTSALVDPVSNKFYVHTSGGFAAFSRFNGPFGLPDGLSFKGKSYSSAQLKALEKAAATTDTKPTKPFHASPQVLSASYSGGIGARPPAGMYAGPRVNLEVLFPNITYKPTWKVKLDEKTKTLTVTVDASEGNPMSKAMAKPQDLMIPVDRPKTLGGTYTLVIKDYQGKVLSKSTFKNMLPM